VSRAEIKVGDFELKIEIESGKIGERLGQLLDAIVVTERAVPVVVAPIQEIPVPKPKPKPVVKKAVTKPVVATKPVKSKIKPKPKKAIEPAVKKSPVAVKELPKPTPVQKKIEQLVKPKAATTEIKKEIKPEPEPEKKPVIIEEPIKPKAKVETKTTGDFAKFLKNFKEPLNEPYTILAFARFEDQSFDSTKYYDAIDSMGKMTPKIRKRFQIYTNLLTKLGKIESPSKGTFRITEKGKIDLDKKR